MAGGKNKVSVHEQTSERAQRKGSIFYIRGPDFWIKLIQILFSVEQPMW